MFNIEYSVWLNGNKYFSKYPNKPEIYGNIFSLKGKNDGGKTTLLKIVAHAFGASEKDNKTISDRLKMDISDLADERNKLNYNLALRYPDKSTTVNIVYDGKEHKYSVNGKPVGKTEFLRQYAVLFEVRENVFDKLNRHMRDVENRFDQYLNYIRIYEGQLRTLYEKIKTYEESKDSLAKTRKSIETLEIRLLEYTKLKNMYDQLVKSARKEYINYVYQSKYLEFQTCELQLKEIKKKMKQTSESDKAISSLAQKLLEKSNELRDEIMKSQLIFQGLNNQELKIEFTEINKNLKILSSLNQLTFDNLSSIAKYFNKVIEFVGEQRKEDISSDKYKEKQELDFLKKLIEIVREFSGTNLELPGSGKKLIDLLEPLENRYKELLKSLNQSDVLEAIYRKSNEIIALIGKVTIELKTYLDNIKQGEGQKFEKVDLDKLEKERKANEERRDKLSKELTDLEDEYKDISPDQKKNFRLDESVVNDYNKANGDYDDTIKKIEETKKNLEVQKQLEIRFRNIQKPKTDFTLLDIISLNEKVNKLKNKFSLYTTKLRDIDLSKLQSIGVTDNSDLEFFSKIGTYLANVVEVVFHEHKMLRVKKIDFQKGAYLLEDGSTLKVNTIGSGHTSLNAIVGRMKNTFPDKKKILLIDEITDMDPAVRALLIKEVKKQIESGESVLALLTEWDYNLTENELVSIT
jgi:ABC-type transport system involved in cytochrome c biogenesis ATPase subunit